jgi:hypothetical protein
LELTVASYHRDPFTSFSPFPQLPRESKKLIPSFIVLAIAGPRRSTVVSLRRPPSPAASTSSNPSLPLTYLYRCGMARGACWCPRPRRSCHRRQATAAASSLPCPASMTGGPRWSARVPPLCLIAGLRVGRRVTVGPKALAGRWSSGPFRLLELFSFSRK